WDYLSENPNITFDIVKNNPDKPWYWRFLSANPNITFEDVKNNPDIPWNYNNLSYNKFHFDKHIFKKHQNNYNILVKKYKNIINYLCFYKNKLFDPNVLKIISKYIYYF